MKQMKIIGLGLIAGILSGVAEDNQFKSAGAPDAPEMMRVSGGALLREDVEITLDSFWIGSHEVTQGELVRVYNKGLRAEEIQGESRSGDASVALKKSSEDLILKISKASPYWGGVLYDESRELMESSPGYNHHPVCRTTWHGAVYYCNARSMEEGLTPCYEKDGKEWVCDFSADGYRLPTEAEWEYAARGGVVKSVADYSGSDDLGCVGWYNRNNEHSELDSSDQFELIENSTHPVGEKLPNELGLYDMSGNAPEWCYDWVGEYSGDPQVNPVGCEMPSKRKEQRRIVRGGGWNSPEVECRVTVRSKGLPEEDTAGFRVVRSVFPNADSVENNDVLK